MTNTVNNVISNDAKNLNLVENFNKDIVAAPAAQYDYVLSFFKRAMKDDSAASNATEAIFNIAAKTQTPVVDLVNTLKNKNELEMTASLAYYLNGIRAPSTLLGVATPNTANFFAARNVVI